MGRTIFEITFVDEIGREEDPFSLGSWKGGDIIFD